MATSDDAEREMRAAGLAWREMQAAGLRYGIRNEMCAPFFTPAAPAMFGGWKCPGCLRCYAPSVTVCPCCPQQEPADLTDEDEGGFAPLAPVALPAFCQDGGVTDGSDEGNGPCLRLNCDC